MKLQFKLGIWKGLKGSSQVMQSLLFMIGDWISLHSFNPCLPQHIHAHVYICSYLAALTIKNLPLKVLHLADL